jgi:hypothetical protein
LKKTTWQTKRDAQKAKERRRKLMTYGGIGIGVVAMIVLVIVLISKSPSPSGLMGEAVTIPSRNHVPDGTVPGPYNSNPPAGGAHYDTDYTERFYQESDLASLPAHPEGYLVHSLEHGYVIFWYNCQAANTDCTSMKTTIQQVMDATGGDKLIAFPWSNMEVPLAMTSWGRILKFDTPDATVMKQFVEHNRYQAPEPDAP